MKFNKNLWVQLLLMISLTIQAKADEIFIPASFQNGEMIEEVILISDVDGVVRDDIESVADPRIIDAIKSLLQNDKVDVTFLSGTPVINDPTLESWRRGGVTLQQVFGNTFQQELLDERVAIFGAFGGHRLHADGSCEIYDEYPMEISFEIGRLLLQAFLKEVAEDGTALQKELAFSLEAQLEELKFEDFQQRNVTANELRPMVQVIRDNFDPHFRLINHGAIIEIQTSNPLWNRQFSHQWLLEQIQSPDVLPALPAAQKRVAAGYGQRDKQGINFIVCSKTNKGQIVQKLIEEKLKRFPKALIVTIGDTQVDFPMHAHAHVAFHVGLEEVWRSHPLPQCFMIRNQKGEDSQHVAGTLKVLKLLEEAIGNSFFDFYHSITRT